MKSLRISLWLNRDQPQRHGYTHRSEDEVSRVRFGPLVIGWEVIEE